MRRFPIVLTVVLVGMWLLLSDSASRGTLLLGTVLALVMTLGFRRMRPVLPRIRRPRSVLKLAGRVIFDIVKSNLTVARIVLQPRRDLGITPGFVDVPLDLRDPHGLAVLATIVTSTPGTVWAGLADDSSRVTLHVLDLHDADAWVATIKNRYERPLMEIFE